jgi:hypothetical protein
MSSPLRAQDAPSATRRVERRPGDIAPFRDAITLSAQRFARTFPAATRLLAECHLAAWMHLYGVGKETRGDHSSDRWNEILLAKKRLQVKDICRLIEGGRKEELAAADAVIAVLLRRRREQRRIRGGSVNEAAKGLTDSHARVIAEVFGALEGDGQVTAGEVPAIRAQLEEHEATCARLRSRLADIEETGR